jgi:predicted amidohydrolase
MPNGQCRRHRKLHTFISGHMDSGSEYTVFDTPHDCRVGVLTCYDNNIVENTRITALMGADLVLAPHQTGGCDLKNPHSMGLVDKALWDNRREDPQAIEAELRSDKGRGWLLRWLPSRAHDNGVFYVFSNGVGVDDDEIRTGNAMILDPYGRILAETWKADDDIVVADLDPALFEKNTGRRWIKTRRPELYNPLLEGTGQEEDTRKVRFNLG